MEESKKETEWWWIDYLEDQFDPTLDKDLETLLAHSQEDRDSFEKFRVLKHWVRESDPAAAWPVDARLPELHARIMNAIEQEQSAHDPVTKSLRA